jgi:hypothetical protein
MIRVRHSVLYILLFACLAAVRMGAQGLTGQISGTIADPSGAAVPNATIELRNTATAQVRGVTTDTSGSFIVTELLPGTYQLKVTASGFATVEQTGLVLTATERLVLRTITLKVGDLVQTTSVVADAVRLQVQSGERSGLITSKQLQEVPLKSRDYAGMLKLLPGVNDTSDREAPRSFGFRFVQANGGRSTSVTATLDGVSQMDTGNQFWPLFTPPVEAIAEVKVMLTNYQAEYGRTTTGIHVVTKGGTREFHGGGYYFKRNEAFNANEFFNNQVGIRRQRYRYDNPGYYLGGPVLIPGLMTKRDKLFFFWSQEWLPRKTPNGAVRRTFPTALERQGNFSQTLDTNGALIPVLDPLNNRQPIAGNVVPANRIDRRGQALLNFFPLPNAADPQRLFNYAFDQVVDNQYRMEVLRVDYNFSSKANFYVRGLNNKNTQSGDYCCLTGVSFPHMPNDYNVPSKGLVASLIYTFSPTLVNEFTTGVSRQNQNLTIPQESLDKNNRDKLGLNLPQFFPQANPLGLIPNASFGGVQNAGAITFENRFPFFGTQTIWNLTDNLSKVVGKHNFKGGFYMEKVARNAARSSFFNGSFDFGRNQLNPFDSNYAYSNALMGFVNSYTESNRHPDAHGRYSNFEWYVQDTWRPHKRLTLELGARFYRVSPTYTDGDKLAAFFVDDFDRNKAPRLIEPYRATPTSARMGRNPVTGEIVPEVKIGTFAPGSGNIINGMRVYDSKVLPTPGVKVAPRFGFAWDVFGKGKTAVRGGFGMFFSRFSDDYVMSWTELRPLVNTSTANYTTIGSLLSTPLSDSPAAVSGQEGSNNLPTTYNWSLGVQQDIGFGTVIDVAYVGSVGRHLLQNRNINATNYGTNYLASSADSTSPGRPLPVNFLRPYQGYGDITYRELASTLNYHSLQMQANRRFTRNLVFGSTWTWSKLMNYQDEDFGSVNPYLNFKRWNYGKGIFDHTHNVTVNMIYDLPKFSNSWNNAVSRTVFDGWQVGGVALFLSGAPSGIGATFVQAIDLTGGSGVDSRVNLTGNPNLGFGSRDPLRFFDTSVVQSPPIASYGIGNAPKDAVRGPGLSNYDLSFYKNFRLGASESRKVQFRFEMYNAFNHTQFTGIDTTSRWDAAGRQVNQRFGQAISAAAARRIQLGLKFSF